MSTLRRVSSVLPLFGLLHCAQPVGLDDATGSNRPPQIRSLSVSPPVVLIGRWVTVRVDAIDPDADPLKFRWSASAGDIIGEGSEVRYTASYCCVGFNTVRVTVEDGRGGSATRGVDIPVVQ